MSVGDTLATPQIMVGVPIPDCNLLMTDETYGLKYGLWTIGADLQGHIKTLPIVHPSDTYTYVPVGGNRYGAGRSVYVDFETNMAGDRDAALVTGSTPFGWVPSYGSASTWYPVILLTHCCSLNAGQSVQITVRHYNAAGAEIDENTIVTLSSSDNTGAQYWQSYAGVNVAGHPLSDDCAYLKVAFYINSNSSSSGYYALDFVGLGWTPGLGVNGLHSFDEAYVGENLKETRRNKIRVHEPPYGGSMFVHQMQRGATYLRNLEMEFLRASATWRDVLNYYWRIQNGMVGGPDAFISGEHDVQTGKPWPLLLRPRRPNCKQAMYCRMIDEPAPLDVSNLLGYVEASPEYSGVVRFGEVDF